MSQIKPIETVYNGYKFRSRLEARWAVFFDEIGVPYEYERQGYQTSAGWYLPDFWMPTWDAHVEIKGKEPTEQDWSKCHSLCRESNTAVLVITGQPWPREYDVQYAFYEEYNGNGQCHFGTCYYCDAIATIEHHLDLHVIFPSGHLADCATLKSNGQRFRVLEDDGPFSRYLSVAFQAARQARFEHGETPGKPSGAP